MLLKLWKSQQLDEDDQATLLHFKRCQIYLTYPEIENNVTMKKIERADLISFLKDNLLTILTLVGVIIGVVLGVSLKETSSEPWTQREAMYLSFIGDLFLNMLRSLIIPLIIPSLIATIGGLNHSLSGKIGLRAVIFYMTTTVIAVILGILLVTIIQPGGGDDEKPIVDESQKRNITTR